MDDEGTPLEPTQPSADPEQPSAEPTSSAMPAAPIQDAPPVGAQPAERVFGAGPIPDATILPGAPDVVVARPRASRSLALAAIFAIVIAAGGAVVAVRAFTDGAPNLDALVPQDSALYVKIAVHPSVDQQRALRGLLERFPGAQAAASATVGDALNGAFAKLGLDYKRDIASWIGDQAAIAVSVPSAAAAAPDIVAMVDVNDDAKARATLDKVKARGAGQGAYVIDGGLAYLGNTAASIEAFRQRGELKPIEGSAEFKSARSSVGGEGLVFVWVDGKRLSGFAAGLAPSGAAGGQGFGSGAYSLRVESQGVVLVGHQVTGSTTANRTGAPALVESTSSNLLAAMTVFDLGGAAKQVEGALAVTPFRGAGQIDSFLGVVGLRLSDLTSWMHGETSLVVGGFTKPPFPDVALIVRPTDDAALARTLAKVRARLGSALKAVAGGFDLKTPQGLTLSLRRTTDRFVIASNPVYAAKLLTAAPDALAADAVYRRVFGGSGDHVGLQIFIRLDRIRTLAEAFLPADQTQRYKTDVQPWLSAFESFAMRLSVQPGSSEFRLVLSVPPK